MLAFVRLQQRDDFASRASSVSVEGRNHYESSRTPVAPNIRPANRTFAGAGIYSKFTAVRMLNAIDAMKESGGELTIFAQPSHEGELLIAVRDTGVGLPSENADQIFESFVTTKAQGTGMGLAIT